MSNRIIGVLPIISSDVERTQSSTFRTLSMCVREGGEEGREERRGGEEERGGGRRGEMEKRQK